MCYSSNATKKVLLIINPKYTFIQVHLKSILLGASFALASPLLVDGAAYAGNTSYGVPTPPGPFVTPLPGRKLPPPKLVPGKEFSTKPDTDTNNNLTTGQSMFWDGLGGTANAIVYSTSQQLDALANHRDALFQAVVQNTTNLLLSFEGDAGQKSIYSVSRDGKIGVWADSPTVKAGAPPSFDLDALEVWGPELFVDANQFSLAGDVLADGSGSCSVINLPGGCKYTRNDIAIAIGNPSLESSIDLDGLMVSGNDILFSIQPNGTYHGGEIWHWDGTAGVGAASSLNFGGITWDTNFNPQTHWANQGFTIASNNIDAIEAASVPGPLPLLGAAAAFRYSRKLRKRLKSASDRGTIGEIATNV